MDAASWYPIGAVARKTGLSVHTLRAWERRYAVVEPHRSAGGTRQYSNADIMRLRLLRRATDAGHSIGQVAHHSVEELRGLLRDENPVEAVLETLPDQSARNGRRRYVEELLKAVELMDGALIHTLLMRAVVALSLQEMVEDVVVPVLAEVGERWAAGAICPANEHLLSVNVRRVLSWLMDAVPVATDAPTLVVTTPVGQWHELGAQIAGVLAADAGWRPVFLGPNLPAADIARAVEITGARSVALGVGIDETAGLVEEMAKLREYVPAEVSIVVGGRGAEPYREALETLGVWYLPDHRSLAAMLKSTATAAATGPA